MDKSSEEGEGNILYGSDGEATDLIPSDLGIGLSSTQDGFVGGYLGLLPVHPYSELLWSPIRSECFVLTSFN